MPSPGDAKAALRAQVRAHLGTLSPADAAARSAAVCTHLSSIPALARAHAVMAFAPAPPGPGAEPDITPVLSSLLSRGVSLALPRIDWPARAMTPAQVTTLTTDLVPSRHGIREPTPHCPALDPATLDVILVPGVAFDRAGHRLGRGGGFFDRFLARPDLRAIRIGVAFSLQLLDNLPTDPHDCPMNLVVTDAGVIDCRPPGGARQ